MTRAPSLLLLFVAGCAQAPKAPPNYLETIPDTTVTFEMAGLPGDGGRVRPFWIGRTEVTWDEYELYYLSSDEADAVTRPTPPYEPPDHGMGREKRPATSMTRQAAERYCEWLSKRTGRAYRLPTEAEWELACRAGDAGQRPADIDALAWHAGNSGGVSNEVRKKQPNGFGLFDMLGNSLEYCADPFGAGDEGPVLRGGSWQSPREEIEYARRYPVLEAWRERDSGRPKSIWWLTDAPMVGFRVARSR
jgi:formylglycine-generating enzyme required for sulfatase activity